MALTDCNHWLKMIKCMMGLEKRGFAYMRFYPFHSVTHMIGNDW